MVRILEVELVTGLPLRTGVVTIPERFIVELEGREATAAGLEVLEPERTGRVDVAV